MSQRDKARELGRRHGPLLVTVITTGLLVLGAALLPESFAWLEQPRGDRVALPRPPAILVYVAVGMMVALFVLALVIGFAGIRDQPPRQSHRIGRQLVFLVAVVAALVTFPSLRQGLERAFDAFPSVERSRDDVGERASPPAPDQPFAYVVALLVGGGLVLGGVALLRAMDSRPTARAEEANDDLLDEIDAGIEDLETIEDPRAAVIACYRRLQRAASDAGVERRPADTPFELLDRLLQRDSVPSERARRLTVLFEQARFSTGTIDDRMRREALDCLVDIRSWMGAEV
jgi:Domain of unknown function (DUF4129)